MVIDNYARARPMRFFSRSPKFNFSASARAASVIFSQDLRSGVDHFLIIAFGGERGELKFQKHEAQRVFQHAAFGVGGKIFLEIQILHAADGVFVVADFAENRAGFFGVKFFQVGAPFQIAGAGHRIIFARAFPAADVLAARGEAQRLREASGTSFKTQSVRRSA